MKNKWWHDKIAYQIYPKSFCDSNGDGIGDIPGIISKLDYLKELGVDIIWISPMYCTPFADQGYDISDYYNIDPVFGTMDDFDELLQETKKRDMYIVMDLVVNHCSDEHEWFKKACEDPDGKYGKYFYIKDWHEGEKLPCNWRSYFGGSVWEPLPGHDDKVYLHLFHKKQPDLNWENPDVREEVFKNVNWWLDKGVAGFRIDAILNIKKALPFSDYPADRDDGMASIHQMLEDANGVDVFLNELADRTFKPHDAFSVGEIFNEKPEQIQAILGNDGYFSTMFDFGEHLINETENGLYEKSRANPEQYKNACFISQERTSGIGFLSNIIENHDEPRGVSRYIPADELNDAAKKMLGGLNVLLRGIPFIFQGQELGMENLEFHDISEVDDIATICEYQVALDAGFDKDEALRRVGFHCRDNARSPVQWTSGKNAGFTTGEPWLRVNPNYVRINAESQYDDPDSVLNWYRQLTALRKNPEFKETLVYGDTVPYKREQKNLMAYLRNSSDQSILVIGNFQKDPQTVELPCEPKQILMNNMKEARISNISDKTNLNLYGYQFVVIEL